MYINKALYNVSFQIVITTIHIYNITGYSRTPRNWLYYQNIWLFFLFETVALEKFGAL